MTTVRRPQSSTPSSRPAPSAKTLRRPASPDALSTGRDEALRREAVKNGATPFSAVTSAPKPAGVTARVSVDGTLVTSPVGRQVTISDELREKAREALYQYTPNPTSLALELRKAQTPLERYALLTEAFANGNAADWIAGQLYGQTQPINEGYDSLTTVADAVAEAYRAGVITDEQLRDLAEELGPERTSVLVQTLALGNSAGGIGGVVEALGEQAEALGYDEAAALAFTSTPQLIAEHYPTGAAQDAAFEHVKEFIERYDHQGDLLDANPALRNAVGAAVTNAARLTANGHGYSPAELQEELDELGPTLSGEIIAQASERSFNGQVPGPLDVLGNAAWALAKGDDDADAWKVNATIAFTQSPALIEANIGTPDHPTGLEAVETLNAYLADNRDEWDSATEGGFSLVRLPQAVEGLNRLLTTDPTLIGQLIDGGPQGEATLVQIFESIALDPNVSQAQRDQLQRTISRYVDTQLASVTEANADTVGARIGTLFGLLQLAGNRAIESADGDSRDAVTDLTLKVTAGVAGALAKSALTGVAGPLGSAIGGVVVTQVLNSLFGPDAPPPRSEIEAKYRELLEANGIDVSGGEVGYDAVKDVYLALHQALSAEYAAADTEAERADITTQMLVVQGLLNGLTLYGDIQDSGEGGGSVIGVLNQRGDEV